MGSPTQAARDQMSSLTRQLVAAKGVYEELKNQDQMEWVQRLNSIRNRSEEVVIREVVYGNSRLRLQTALNPLLLVTAKGG